MSDIRNQCCCRWGAGIAGEWPEFECADCPRHGGPDAQGDIICRRHRRERAAQAAAASDLAVTVAALQEAMDAIAGVAPYGVELLPDGREDPATSAWVEGLRDAHAAVKALILGKQMHGPAGGGA